MPKIFKDEDFLKTSPNSNCLGINAEFSKFCEGKKQNRDHAL